MTEASRLTDGGEFGDAAIRCLASPLKHAAAASFSSDLSVDEAVLLDEAGYEPRRLVMGASLYHIGWAGTGWAEGEVIDVTKALHDARNLAVSRLLRDAGEAGGQFVVGVRLSFGTHGRHAEFTAIGTAVARRGAKPGRRRGVEPVATDLSGQDFYLLQRAGYEPVGIVFGNCVYYVPPNWGAAISRTNIELEAPTRALATARERAMERLQYEAVLLGARGVVGVTAREHQHGRAVEFLAVGTAVRLREGAGESGAHVPIEVRPVVDLQDSVVTTDPGAITGKAAAAGAGE
jgi:uncharacterized protein YbjQ (UPF0145 family)